MPGTTDDDAALGARLRAGDEDAFVQLYQRYLPRLYDFAARLLRDPSAADDLVQSTFIRAYEHRDALREAAKVRSWLFTTAHNLAMNHLERRRPAESVEDRWDLAAPGRGPEAEAVAGDAAEMVWAAAASLEPRQYAILDMSVRQELTTPEIAEVLGLPTAHAAVLVNRAREALRNAVRFLMVARRRDHCPRLAELVPAGIRALSPEQRSTVDYHMRQCQDCQVMGRRLTDPAELFGGLALLPVPAHLTQWQGLPGPQAPRHGRPASRTPRSQVGFHGFSGLPAIAVLALGVIAIGSGGAALLLHNRAQPARASAPAATSTLSPGVATPRQLPGDIVFAAGTTQFGNQAFSVMKPDGTGVHALPALSGPLCCGAPALSPDGTKLVFTGEGQVTVADQDGAQGHGIWSSSAGLNGPPVWSPSGKEIAFVVSSGVASNPSEIDVVSADGSSQRRILQGSAIESANSLAWSPDGSAFAFVSSSGEIDVAPASGGRARALTGPQHVGALSWAPGPALLFSAVTTSTPAQAGIQEIAADGTGLRTVISSIGYHDPSWGPDGVHFLALSPAGQVVVATTDPGSPTTIGPPGVSYAQWGGAASSR